MPYIPAGDRNSLDSLGDDPTTAAQLSYIIASEVADYIDRAGLAFSTLAEVIGGRECAKLEIYRRIGVSYEDGKKAQNGDLDSIHNVLYTLRGGE